MQALQIAPERHRFCFAPYTTYRYLDFCVLFKVGTSKTWGLLGTRPSKRVEARYRGWPKPLGRVVRTFEPACSASDNLIRFCRLIGPRLESVMRMMKAPPQLDPKDFGVAHGEHELAASPLQTELMAGRSSEPAHETASGGCSCSCPCPQTRLTCVASGRLRPPASIQPGVMTKPSLSSDTIFQGNSNG